MKIPIVATATAVTGLLLVAQPREASAGPVTFVVAKTTNLVHRAAYRIDRHVIEPGRRVIVRHTPRVRRAIHRAI